MGKELDNIDLSLSERKEITALLKHYLPDTEVWAYGSRVKFTAKPSSDLDLVAFTSKDQNAAVANLREAFEESSLPFRVDLFIWDRVPKQFHKNIEAERVVLQKREDKKNLPEGWKEKTLSEIVNLIGGGTPKRSIEEYWNGNIPWLSVKDFNNEYRHVDYAEQTITELGLQKSSTKILERGQLIISARGTVGMLAQLSRPMAFNQSCYGINAKIKYTENNFLYYLIKYSVGSLKQITHGAVFDTITRETFNHITVNLPPLSEQKAIAHILGSLDDKIELNRRMNETLEAMAQALFKSWFVDFDPVIDNALAAGNEIPQELKKRAKIRKALGNTRKPLPEELRNLFPSEFEYTEEMGWIPKGWIETNIEDIAAKVAMGPFGSSIKVSTFVSSGIPIISGQHLNNTLLEDNTYNFITEEHAEKLKNSNVYRGDIIFTHAGNIGQVSYIPETSEYERYVLSQRQFYLRCDESKISPFFMIYFFKSPEGQHKILANTSSTGVPSISRPVSYLKMIEFIKPSDNIIEYFSQIIKDSHSRMGELVWEIKTLTKLREALLPKLLSGEIRISDAEKLVEDLEINGGQHV